MKAPDLHCFTEWRCVLGESTLPNRSGKFVVQVDEGGVCYLSTRSYNVESKAWLNMKDGERVSYWLEYLRMPGELLTPRAPDYDTRYRGCLHCAAQPGEYHDPMCPNASQP